jgi:hypothetical protein
LPYATGSTGLALTVRGSSRRIMIMRFRPANIRLINRRSNLLRLLLALSSGKSKNNDNYKSNPTDPAELTQSLHIRAMHSLTIDRVRLLPISPVQGTYASSASKIFRHSGVTVAFKTTFEVFTRVGPDNSLERLTERSVGLVTDGPSDVYELFVTLLE